MTITLRYISANPPAFVDISGARRSFGLGDDRPISQEPTVRKNKTLNHARHFGLPRIALAAAALLACGQASAALLAIGSGSTITTVGSGSSRNNVLGGGVALWDNVSLATTAPAVLKFFYLGSESGLKNTLNLSGGLAHTDTDKINAWSSATPLFEITIDAAGAGTDELHLQQERLGHGDPGRLQRWQVHRVRVSVVPDVEELRVDDALG